MLLKEKYRENLQYLEIRKDPLKQGAESKSKWGKE